MWEVFYMAWVKFVREDIEIEVPEKRRTGNGKSLWLRGARGKPERGCADRVGK